jgi:hypothetical protein
MATDCAALSREEFTPAIPRLILGQGGLYFFKPKDHPLLES